MNSSLLQVLLSTETSLQLREINSKTQKCWDKLAIPAVKRWRQKGWGFIAVAEASLGYRKYYPKNPVTTEKSCSNKGERQSNG